MIAKHNVDVWLINTGWSGGPYGVGERMDIGHTRAMVHAALDGSLHNVPMATDPYFGLSIPASCPNVPAEVLSPRSTWSDPSAYDLQAAKLAEMFVHNFKRFAAEVPKRVQAAGPQQAAEI